MCLQLFETTLTLRVEKEMATYSSVLAWRIPTMEEPGRLESIVSQRVVHDWVTSLSLSLREFLNSPAWKSIRGHLSTLDWFKIEKRVHQGCMLSPYLFNLYAEYIMQNSGLDKSQAGVKMARRNINKLRYAHDNSNSRKCRETKKPFDEGKRGDWMSWLKSSTFKKLISWHLVPSFHSK